MRRAIRGILGGGLLAIGLVCGPPSTRAAGTIDTTDSTITVGSGTPAGMLAIEPNAAQTERPDLPALGTLGSIGTITGALPAFPADGSEQFESLAVEAHRMVESERPVSVRRGLGVVLPGTARIARPFEMQTQRLGVRVPVRLQNEAEATVQLAPALRFESREHRLPDTIVVRVQILAGLRALHAHEPDAAQCGQHGGRCTHLHLGGDTYIRMMLLWGALLPLGSVWSIDAKRDSADGAAVDPNTRAYSWVSFALVSQFLLFYLVVNGIAFALAATLVSGFSVSSFGSAIAGALVVGLASWIIGSFTKDDKE